MFGVHKSFEDIIYKFTFDQTFQIFLKKFISILQELTLHMILMIWLYFNIMS